MVEEVEGLEFDLNVLTIVDFDRLHQGQVGIEEGGTGEIRIVRTSQAARCWCKTSRVKVANAPKRIGLADRDFLVMRHHGIADQRWEYRRLVCTDQSDIVVIRICLGDRIRGVSVNNR